MVSSVRYMTKLCTSHGESLQVNLLTQYAREYKLGTNHRQPGLDRGATRRHVVGARHHHGARHVLARHAHQELKQTVKRFMSLNKVTINTPTHISNTKIFFRH